MIRYLEEIMLREWSVRGFKSIRDAPQITLRRINVFAGANSSGKSSLLQSILLLKQTLQYGAPNRPLSLNGPILRLGTLEEIIFAGSDPKELELGFKIDVSSSAPVRGAPWNEIANRRAYLGTEVGQIVEIAASFKWSPAPPSTSVGESSSRLQVSLNSGSFVVDRASGDRVSRSAYRADFKARGAGASGEWFGVTMDPLSEAEVSRDRPEASVTALYITHFLPTWAQVRFNAGKLKARTLAQAIFEPRSLLHSSTPMLKEPVPVSALVLINQWLQTADETATALETGATVDEVTDRFQPYLQRRIRTGVVTAQRTLFSEKAVELRALQDEVEIAIATELNASGPAWESDVEQPRTLGGGAEFIRSYFKSGVRYLGPLRDEPRPVYPLEALENTTDVGYRGEHTAAVLELNAQSRISYIPSSAFAEGYRSFRPVNATLKAAVVDWLGYMGVAQDVDAREEGVFGNRLQVTTAGLNKFHDLTNVGVGVSQVLPIVVSSLLAPTTSLLLFEQPELHLHPRVQARLADFFLAITMSDRQCILETHSEYLVERFRRRIAEDESQDLEENLAIYFAERENGETRFRPVVVTRYGAIEDWPKDFFDQSEIESSHILEAASKKRARSKKGAKA